MIKRNWKLLLYPKLQENQDERIHQKVMIAHRLILTTLCINIAYLTYYLITRNINFGNLCLLDIAINLFCFILLRKGHLNLSRNFFALSINLSLFLFIQIKGPAAGDIYWFIPFAAAAFILFDFEEPKRQFIFAIIPIIFLGTSDIVNLSWIPKINYNENIILTSVKVNIITAVMATLYCVYYAMRLNKLSTNKLAQEKANLSTLIENIPNSIWKINTNYEIVFQNSTFKKSMIQAYGEKFQEGFNILKESIKCNAIYSDVITKWKTYYDRGLKGETFSVEDVMESNGKLHYKEIWIGPVLSNGKITGVIANSKDITERKEQEKLLLQSLERNKMLALVASTTSYMVIITDAEKNIEWTNSGFEINTGHKLENTIGKNINDLLKGELSNETILKDFEIKLSGKKAFSTEIIYYKANREPFWINMNVSPLFNDNNEVINYILIGMDISDQKRAEDQLQMLLKHSQKLNKQLQSRDSDLQKSIRDLNKQSWELQLSEEKLRKQKNELENLNNELTGNAIQLRKQNELMNIKNEELEKAKITLANKADQLEQSSRYKSEFLANMSHELRTPLNSIIILSRLLSENKEATLTKKQLEFAKVVNKSGSDLLNLINDILDLSKIEAGGIELEKEDFSIEDITLDIENLFSQIAQEKGIEFKITNNTIKESKVHSDRHRISQVLKNLISNAFKFTPKGGFVELAINIESDNSISFSVIDTGIGIPYEKQQLIFESFKQVDGSISRKYGGTGLGLSISREITSLLDGTIHLKSTVGKGSEFTIKIPIGKTEESQNSIAIKGDSASAKTLLIIEDDEIFSGILEKAALLQGFKTFTCNRGDTGYMRICELIPDGILLDMNLPGMDGKSLLKKLQRDPKLKNIPVHVISSLKSDINQEELPIISWLQKPVNVSQLNTVFKSINKISQNSSAKVLVIEDSPEQSLIIKNLLERQNINCNIAESGNEALLLTKKNIYDCIILDLNLPDSDGLQILKTVKEDSKLSNVPVIVYSSRDLTDKDKIFLRNYASSYVRKSPLAFDLLMDETQLFLRSVKEQKARITPSELIIKAPDKLSGRKVLVVDDDQRNIYAITSMLEIYNINLITAKNGNEALTELENNPDIDFVLMDIMMPEMNGYEATVKIRKQERFRNLPIIALTAKAMKDDHIRTMEAGMNDHVTKPIDSGKLIQLMNSYFE